MKRFARCLAFPFLLIGLLGLTGCAGRDYSVPDAGFMPEQAVLGAFSVDRGWWKAYADPQLDALVDRALRNNIDLAKSAISVNKALYQARYIGADLVPSFSSGANASSTTNTSTGVASRSFEASLSMSYELDLWARLRNAASAQAWEYMATVEDREAARLALINNVVTTYYNLQYLHQAREITAQSLAFFENLVRIVDEKHRVGSVDGLEPTTARQSLLAARNSLMDLETQAKTAEQTMRNLLNLTPQDALLLEYFDLMSVPAVPVDLSVPVAALGLRPDVRAAEYRIQRSFKDWEASRESLYPSVTIGGSLSVSSGSASTVFDVPLLGGSVKINVPFLQYNKLRWNIKTSEASFDEAQLNFSQKVHTALGEVDTNYFAYQQSLTLLENIILKHEADAQISAYRETRYNVGADELRDWLQARNTENDSMLSVLQAKQNVIGYENAIYQAMGGRLSSSF